MTRSNISLLSGRDLTSEQTGKPSEEDGLYYLFELGRPLLLQNKIQNVPHRPIRNTMCLTTLSSLQDSVIYKDIVGVYVDALK